jgi:hypothetical protein
MKLYDLLWDYDALRKYFSLFFSFTDTLASYCMIAMQRNVEQLEKCHEKLHKNSLKCFLFQNCESIVRNL